MLIAAEYFRSLVLVTELLKMFLQFRAVDAVIEFSLQAGKLFGKLHHNILLQRLEYRTRGSFTFRKRNWR